MAQSNRMRSTEKCRYCNEPEVVPVLDRRIEEGATAGNKYRQFCLACHRWLPMCSTAHYETHPNPHFLPVDAEPVAENLVERSELIESDSTERTQLRSDGSGTPTPESRGEPNSTCSPESPTTDVECGLYQSMNGSRLVVTFPLDDQQSDSLSECLLSVNNPNKKIGNAIRDAVLEELNK